MLKKRLIPCLFLKNGFLVRSQGFNEHQLLGNAIHQVERFNAWEVDELIYIDITRDDHYDIRRDDMKVKSESDILKILEAVSKTCFMPLTFGGRIRTLQDIYDRISRGADKVTINTQALADPTFITESSMVFGSQAIVVSIDVKLNANGEYEVYSHHGQQPTGLHPVAWAKQAEQYGAGEIFLNSIDRDGMANGYDTALIRQVAEAVSIPVIACGGVGQFKHLAQGINDGLADAVAAGNIFHFTELSGKRARKELLKAGIHVRN
ncbi:imidazole glycerol phosphate synthase subunit HisF [Vampirovibrio chlorellavorus]|uniref:imidazole glycerol phosphate synthase subunit HisF n=1 Tax=Vampirovibrio chlorellavorus TaxID=758823 RepID=UPI0026EC0145|nr:imidazole glycerol phosphate synthase cyclase subunit [Vampirovibrio chlorellavorus]